MSNDEMVDIDVSTERETAGAYLVKVADSSAPDGERSLWLPKSQCEAEDGKVTACKRWLAEKEGLV